MVSFLKFLKESLPFRTLYVVGPPRLFSMNTQVWDVFIENKGYVQNSTAGPNSLRKDSLLFIVSKRSSIEELGVKGSGNARSVRRLKAGDLQPMFLLLAFQGMLESSTVLVVWYQVLGDGGRWTVVHAIKSGYSKQLES